MATITTYRADGGKDRTLQEGFVPRSVLPIEQARDLIRVMTGIVALKDVRSGLGTLVPTRFALEKDDGWELTFSIKNNRKPSKDEINAYDRDRTNRDPAVLMEWVVRTGQGIMPHVSLCKTDGCGGYNDGTRYVFKATVTGVEQRSWRDAVGVRRTVLTTWPKLWMDHAELAHATIIAIEQVQDAKEVTFFTPISPDNIELVFTPANPAPKKAPVPGISGDLTCVCGATFAKGMLLKTHQMGCL